MIITARIASIFVSSTAVHMYDFHIFPVKYFPCYYNKTKLSRKICYTHAEGGVQPSAPKTRLTSSYLIRIMRFFNQLGHRSTHFSNSFNQLKRPQMSLSFHLLNEYQTFFKLTFGHILGITSKLQKILWWWMCTPRNRVFLPHIW